MSIPKPKRLDVLTPKDIIHVEDRILGIVDHVVYARQMLANEIHPAPGTPLLPANRDYWKTLALNAKELVNELTLIIEAVEIR